MAKKRIKDLATSITAFRSGDVIVVDGPDNTAKMSKGDLLIETAQNALGSIKSLDTTATTSDLKDGNYFVLDGSEGTKKLPADQVLAKPTSTITGFRTGDVIPVDGSSGTAKMGKDDLLKETAQNALGSIKSLDTTATTSDLKDGNYFVLDGSEGTQKLPADQVLAKPTSLINMFDTIYNSILVVGQSSSTARMAGYDLFRLAADEVLDTGVAPLFMPFTDYEVGNLVTWEGKLYKCTTAHRSSAFNYQNWDVTRVADELSRSSGSTDIVVKNVTLSGSGKVPYVVELDDAGKVIDFGGLASGISQLEIKILSGVNSISCKFRVDYPGFTSVAMVDKNNRELNIVNDSKPTTFTKGETIIITMVAGDVVYAVSKPA